MTGQPASSTTSRIGGSNRLVSAPELADRFNVPVATIYHEWRAWGLKGLKVGKHLRFRERDIDAWLDRRAA
jgi:excisionase family DNA binding protein